MEIDINQALSQLALIGSLSERLVEFVKPLYREKIEESKKKVVAMYLNAAANVGVCVYWQVDLFASAGFQMGAFGSVATGVVASLGTAVIHELAEILKQLRAPKG